LSRPWEGTGGNKVKKVKVWGQRVKVTQVVLGISRFGSLIVFFGVLVKEKKSIKLSNKTRSWMILG